MSKKTSGNQFLAKIYTHSFFDDLVFIYPLYTVMFVHYGLSPLQISAILMVWSGSAFALEVPSGIIADAYSRKYVLLFAQLARIAGFSVWIFLPSFFGFLTGFFLWGIKSAFTSGTFEALVYDELKATGASEGYAKIIGRSQSLRYTAILLAGLGASLTVGFGYPVILGLGIISLCISCVALLSLPNPRATKSTGETRYFKTLREGLSFVFLHRSILNIVIFISLAQALFGALDEYWSIFAQSVGLPPFGIGLFAMLYGGVQAAASLIAYKCEHLSRQFFYLLFLLNGILLLLAAQIYMIFSLLLLCIFGFFFKLSDIVMHTQFQHGIPSNTRATVSSVQGFFVELTVMLFYLTFGLVSRSWGYQKGFITFGWIIVAIGSVYLLCNVMVRMDRKIKTDGKEIPSYRKT